MRFKPLVLVRDADELGTAVVHRLFRSRFRVVIAATESPRTLLKGCCFTPAIVSGSFEVEGVAVRKAVVTETLGLVDREVVPLLFARFSSLVEVLNPEIIVDGAEPGSGDPVTVGDASLVIGLGRGFTAGENCDVVVDPGPGIHLGRLLYRGGGEGEAGRVTDPEVVPVSAGAAGMFEPARRFGQPVNRGDLLGTVGGQPVEAPAMGVVRGILCPGVEVSPDWIAAEVDTTGDEERCYAISPRNRTLSGAVLEAVVTWTADVGGFPYP